MNFSSEERNSKPLVTQSIDRDLKDRNESFTIGSIVSIKAHPYQLKQTGIKIAAYNHFLPPLMVIIEKKYGTVNYNSTTGESEDNDSFKCIYYCTQSGSLAENWFRKVELRLVNDGDLSFSNKNTGKSLNELNKQIGYMAILTTVDFELGKEQMWLDLDKNKQSKTLLDFLPPLGTIIDFKQNEEYQKFNEKNGRALYRKSKFIVKLRWWNNHSSKYSEEYFPMAALKIVSKDDLEIKIFNSPYLKNSRKIKLENQENCNVNFSPLKFYDVLWNHYYYIYRFENLFTQQIIEISRDELNDISEIENTSHSALDAIFKNKKFDYKSSHSYFGEKDKMNFLNKWFEIEYVDKVGKYTKRIIYITELLLSENADFGVPDYNERRTLIANCLLRNGAIRNFNISRIQGYREMPKEFTDKFVTLK